MGTTISPGLNVDSDSSFENTSCHLKKNYLLFFILNLVWYRLSRVVLTDYRFRFEFQIAIFVFLCFVIGCFMLEVNVGATVSLSFDCFSILIRVSKSRFSMFLVFLCRCWFRL